MAIYNKSTAQLKLQAREADFVFLKNSIINSTTMGPGEIKLASARAATDQVMEQTQTFQFDYAPYENVTSKFTKPSIYENFAVWQKFQALGFDADNLEEYLTQLKNEDPKKMREATLKYSRYIDTNAFAYISEKTRVGNVIGEDVATTSTSVAINSGVATATFTVDSGFTPTTENVLNKGIQIGTDKEFYRIYEVTSVTSQVVVAKIKTDYNIAEAIYEGEAQSSTTGSLRGVKALTVTKSNIYETLTQIEQNFAENEVDTTQGVSLICSPKIKTLLKVSDQFAGQGIIPTYRGIILNGYLYRVDSMDVFTSNLLPVDETTGETVTLAYTRDFADYERRTIEGFAQERTPGSFGYSLKGLFGWFINVKPLSNKGSVKLLLKTA